MTIFPSGDETGATDSRVIEDNPGAVFAPGTWYINRPVMIPAGAPR